MPREYSSVETQRRGPITKAGHSRTRWLLIQAPVSLLRRRPPQAEALRTWALRIAARRGKQVAAVALARRLAGILYALLRGLLYATGFMIVMQLLGLNLAPTAILAIPAVLLIAFGFAALGMAVTSYMKTFQQMDWINFVLLPMFLFSATLFPITIYPEWIQSVIMAFPLWHGVELIRGLTTGVLSPDTGWHILYFVVMIAVGLVFTTKRLRALFLD